VPQPSLFACVILSFNTFCRKAATTGENEQINDGIKRLYGRNMFHANARAPLLSAIKARSHSHRANSYLQHLRILIIFISSKIAPKTIITQSQLIFWCNRLSRRWWCKSARHDKRFKQPSNPEKQPTSLQGRGRLAAILLLSRCENEVECDNLFCCLRNS
jgi:hypothetical protein